MIALEYEAVAKRTIGEITLDEREVDNILDFVISKANCWQIFYLWRPELNDPGDDMVLELAEKVAAIGAQDYLEKRAKRASEAKFDAAMAKVADVEPPDYDRL